MRTVSNTPDPGRSSSSATGASRAPKTDSFGNTLSTQKGDSGERIKVSFSGDTSRWKSGVTKFEGGGKIQLTVPGTRWMITIPKKSPQTAHADDPFHNFFDHPVQIGENPSQVPVPRELKNEPFAVFDDGNGKWYGIGLNSLYFASGAAKEKEETQPPADGKSSVSGSEPKGAAPGLTSNSPPPLRTQAFTTVPPPPTENFSPPSHPLQGGEGGSGPALGPRATQAQNDVNQALASLQKAEMNTDPAEIRLLARYKQQAEMYASQAAQSSGMGGDTARYSLPGIYSNLIVRGAQAGELKDPTLAGAAKNYLQRENYLKTAYLQDAWGGIQDAWKSSSPAWQKYYESRWNSFYGKSPDPWRAFASDVVANAAPTEGAIKAAAQNYLQYDQLRHTGMNPFLYPMALSQGSGSFQEQQFTIPGFPGGGVPNVLGGLNGSPLMQALYGNIQSGLAQQIGWIANLWGGPASSYYNFPQMRQPMQ